MTKPTIPTFEKYMNPIISALHQLGGSATNLELYEKVIEDMHINDEQLSVMHDSEQGNQTEVSYRMAWAKTYLKKTGYLDNSGRGVWSLTKQGLELHQVDEKDIVQNVKGKQKVNKGKKGGNGSDGDTTENGSEEGWRSELLTILREMNPQAFERLTQRILRESGFVEVHVTGRSGDGGIDGTGILRLQSLVSFHVFFQCKKWQGNVGAREIRDFRGAMVGRTDKGIFITTGSFTREAQKEATRDGAPPIDLIDGDQLMDRLKELSLGLTKETVEKVTVNREWFEGI